MQRSCATEVPAKSVDDGFLNIRMDEHNVLPDLTGTTTSPGITAYDSNTLNDLFRKSKKSWKNTLYPRIFAIQVVILRDAAVFKFSMQHTAGDAIGMCLRTSISPYCIADKDHSHVQCGYRFLRRASQGYSAADDRYG